MSKCSYCGKNYEAHKGVILVDSISGHISYLCSSKCRKNTIMKRKKKKWTRPKKLKQPQKQ